MVLRATWPEESVTGRELLERIRAAEPEVSEEALNTIDAAIAADRAPKDKWTGCSLEPLTYG